MSAGCASEDAPAEDQMPRPNCSQECFSTLSLLRSKIKLFSTFQVTWLLSTIPHASRLPSTSQMNSPVPSSHAHPHAHSTSAAPSTTTRGTHGLAYPIHTSAISSGKPSAPAEPEWRNIHTKVDPHGDNLCAVSGKYMIEKHDHIKWCWYELMKYVNYTLM